MIYLWPFPTTVYQAQRNIFLLKICIAQTKTLSIVQLLTSLGNPSEYSNCNFARCISQTQTLSIIMFFASLGNENEDKNCYFERGCLTAPYFIIFFYQLKGATNILLEVPPRSLLFFCDSRIRTSKEYAA